MPRSFEDPNVERVFDSFPHDVRDGLLELRELIFQVAERTEGVGPLHETLKWGQPAYLTLESKSGSTLRLGLPKSGGFAIYAHCQTSIISDFQAYFPEEFDYEGNRAIHFAPARQLQLGKLELLVHHALTYHNKRNDKSMKT